MRRSLVTLIALSLFINVSHADREIPVDYIIHPILQRNVGYYSVILPPGYFSSESANATYPLCVLVHGRGQTEERYQYLLSDYFPRDQVIYLMARAPHPANLDFFGGETGYTVWPEDYTRESTIVVDDSLKIDPMVIERLYTGLIAECIRDARSRYRISDKKIAIFGHSQGAAFGFRFAVDHPDLVDLCFVHAGAYYSRLDGDHAGKVLLANGTKVIVTHNEDDPHVEVQHSRELVKYLEGHQVDVENKFYRTGGHDFNEEGRNLARKFLIKWSQDAGDR